MNRRQFLVRIGGTLVAVPFVLQAVGCDEDDPAQPQQTDRFGIPSSTNSGHSHRITFMCSDLSLGTLTYTSSTDGGHFHSLTLTLPQVQSIAAGQSVGPVFSSTADGHDHTWTIQKPSNVC